MSVTDDSESWVSKTDVIRYVRCPYAFWLLDRGELTVVDAFDDFHLGLLAEGRRFQQEVEERAAALPGRSLRAAIDRLGGEVSLIGTPPFENARLRIRGRPDGICLADGDLLPIEVKSHRDVQRTDELELAFYWLVLEPYQRRKHKPVPRGQLILRRDGQPQRVDVTIRPERIGDVRRLVKEVRTARRDGVRIRICGCPVCRGLRSEMVALATQERQDLTLIAGIGRRYAEILEEAGIATWADLLETPHARVADVMRTKGSAVSLSEAERWRAHAQAWQEQRPIFFGEEPWPSEPFIAVDLEYDPTLIWLIGACLVEEEESEYITLWADDEAEERANLRRFASFLEAHPSIPIVTWAGASAEFPRLRRALDTIRLDEIHRAFAERHVDLYAMAVKGLRLPIPMLNLKDIGAYLGVPRLETFNRDGHMANFFYERRRAHDTDRADRYKQQLIDFDALVAVARRISELTVAEPSHER
jgi:predicted RecB family nuclease